MRPLKDASLIDVPPHHIKAVHCTENPIYVFSEMKLPGLGLVHSYIIYSQDWSANLAAAKKTDRSWKYINRSQIHDCENWETEHYNSVWK
jgi:hypothetical protein